MRGNLPWLAVVRACHVVSRHGRSRHVPGRCFERFLDRDVHSLYGNARGYWIGGLQDKIQSKTARGISGNHGPMQEYDSRIRSGMLQEDEHQRHLVQALQDLHEMLNEVAFPTAKHSFLSRVFGRRASPEAAPRGLYMYGDVGSGKTMLMDMFYDTLSKKAASKNRIHFHAFMQDVHHRLHVIRSQQGENGVQQVAAEIASQARVLCFDEFQCTDVADAMILRG